MPSTTQSVCHLSHCMMKKNAYLDVTMTRSLFPGNRCEDGPRRYCRPRRRKINSRGSVHGGRALRFRCPTCVDVRSQWTRTLEASGSVPEKTFSDFLRTLGTC